MSEKQRLHADIRRAMKAKNITVWKMADLLNVSEMTVYRLFRHELPDEKKRQIMQLIDDYREE